MFFPRDEVLKKVAGNYRVPEEVVREATEYVLEKPKKLDVKEMGIKQVNYFDHKRSGRCTNSVLQLVKNISI